MPRYFFNLRWGRLSVCDARGEDCAGSTEAVQYALLAALGLMSEKGDPHCWADWSVDIQDEARNQVATVPFTFALRTGLRRGDPPHLDV
jgi:hypothetical protein